MNQKLKANKINIYPIEVTMEGDGGLFKGQAYKITSLGMIIEVFVSALSPQQILKLKWVLPVENISMESDAIIVKRYAQPRDQKIQHLIEVHFRNLKPPSADAIKSLVERFDAMIKKQNDGKTSKS